MIRIRSLFLLTALFFSFSCSKKNDTCSYDPCASIAQDAEIKQVEAYLTSKTIAGVKHCSGLYYVIETEGTGSAPTSCSTVSVTYKGSLTNGTVFNNATTPVSFGLTTLISGWKIGLPLIKKGGKIKLFVPPDLGYGASPNGSIPANSILIFDINLVDVR